MSAARSCCSHQPSAVAATAMPSGRERWSCGSPGAGLPSIPRACRPRAHRPRRQRRWPRPTPASQNGRLRTETTMAMTRREWVGKAAALGHAAQAGAGRKRRNAEDLAPVSGRHRRRRRFPRPALPSLRRRHREAQQRRAEGRGLSGLVADEDELPVLGDAQGRARHQPLPDAVRRRRGRRMQHRPDAGAGAELRGGRGLEDLRGRPHAGQDARRQGHRPAELDLAGRRRRQPRHAAGAPPKTPRA